MSYLGNEPADSILTADQLATGVIEDKLGYTPANSIHTHVAADITDLGSLGGGSGGISYTLKTANYTILPTQGIIADTSGGSFTLTLPAQPVAGTQVFIADGANWVTNNLIVDPNGETIEDASGSLTCDIGGVELHFVYNGSTWNVYTPSVSTVDSIMTGPTSSTDNTIPRFDGTTGKLLQGSGVVVDDSNNVGIGVTPSAWAAGNKFIDVNASASFGAFGASDAMLLSNAYWGGSNWLRKNANNAWRTVAESSSGAPSWSVQYAANGAAGSVITWSTAMTLGASGNLSVNGLVSAGLSGTGSKFRMNSTTTGRVWDWSSEASDTMALSHYNGASWIAPVLSITSSGNLTLNSGTLGYGTGAGGTVTQVTSKSTAVTLNKPSGRITTTADALGANSETSFVLYNSFIGSYDTVHVVAANNSNYTAVVGGLAAGLCNVILRNRSGGSLSEAVQIQFVIIKGATA